MENNFNITAASVSDRGLSEKRPENEDSFLVLEERGLYAVADGVGGAQAGDVASQMAVEILGEAFLNQSGEPDAEDVMRLAIERANSAIFQMASDLPQLSSMATTVVALQLKENIATIGHVGDSRVYRRDGSGLIRETNDHSVVEEEVRAGRMTPEQAQNHPSKNIISRALGAEADVEIDLKTIMVEPGTTFLLCSDGITRHIDDHELSSFLAMDAEPAEICARLKDVCYERGAEDNLTAVIVRVAGSAAEQYQTAAAGAASDHDDEATIASARSPFESTVSDEDETDEINSDDFASGKTLSIDELDDQSYLMDEAEERVSRENAAATGDYASSSVVVPAAVPADSELTFGYPKAPPRVKRERHTSGASSLSKALSAIAFLLLGAIFGVGGYYYWLQSQPEPVVQAPVITEMKSNNTALTAFEEGRRQVDVDPAKYVNANAASPQVAEDYFLLGRAFLLTGKYWEAKRSFTEARNRLSTVDPNNAKTLAAEISMALAIIESPQATEIFNKDMTTAASGTASNSNVNAVTNVPAYR